MNTLTRSNTNPAGMACPNVFQMNSTSVKSYQEIDMTVERHREVFRWSVKRVLQQNYRVHSCTKIRQVIGPWRDIVL